MPHDLNIGDELREFEADYIFLTSVDQIKNSADLGAAVIVDKCELMGDKLMDYMLPQMDICDIRALYACKNPDPWSSKHHYCYHSAICCVDVTLSLICLMSQGRLVVYTADQTRQLQASIIRESPLHQPSPIFCYCNQRTTCKFQALSPSSGLLCPRYGYLSSKYQTRASQSYLASSETYQSLSIA